MPSQPRKRKRTPAPKKGVLTAVGAQVRKVRTEKGISQSQLGAPYFTRAHISAIELGKVSPALKSLVHFAEVLKVSVHDLIPRDL